MRFERIVCNGGGDHYLIIWLDDQVDGVNFVSRTVSTRCRAFHFRRQFDDELKQDLRAIFASITFGLQPNKLFPQWMMVSEHDLAVMFMLASVHS